jgi:hypothetical protein
VGIADRADCIGRHPAQLYLARFLLKATEAAFSGVSSYLSHWFEQDRAKATSNFMSAILSFVIDRQSQD